MTATRPLAVLAVTAAALLLPAAPAQAACNVTVGFPNFSPATHTVQAGSTVTWCWAEGNHSVDGSFGDSGVRNAGAEYTITFANAGTFQYQCGVHGSMQASIVVQGSQPSPTKSPSPKPTTKSPTPARTTAPPPARTTAPPPIPAPPPTTAPVTPTPTTAAPTTSAPATTTAPEPTTSAPATPSITPAAAQPLDPAPAKPKTGLAIAVGLLVAAAGIGGAVWLLLRGRAG